MRTSEAIDIYRALDAFIKKDILIPAQAAWDIEDNYEILKKIQDKFNNYQNKILQPLIEKNGIKQEGDQILPVEGFENEYLIAANEIYEYLETNNDVHLKKIKKSQLPDSLSVKDIQALKFMIISEEGDED